jgi:hypothetical protein
MEDRVQDNQQAYVLPFHLMVLEAIGAVLVGLGIPKVVGGFDVVPAQFLFAGYGPVFIGVGVLLMLPGIISLLRQLKERTLSGERRDL